MLSIKAAVDAHAARSNRVWDEDRSQTVGASEIGQCARKTWFAKFAADEAIPQDDDYDDRWGAKVRGTVYEAEWWAPALRAQFGDQLIYAGDDQRTLFLDYLSATPDGMIRDLPADALTHLGVADIGSDTVAVECKTIDPRTKIDRPKPEHVHQVIVQLGLLRATTVYQPHWGLLSYTDTSFWDEVHEFPIAFDPQIFAASLDRAAQIMTATDPFSLRPEGRIAGGRECEFCPFRKACGLTQARRAEATNGAIVPPEEAAPILAKARQVNAHKAVASREEAAAKVLEEEIKQDLSRLKARAIAHDGEKVAWSAVKGRESTDLKALRSAAEAEGFDVSRFIRSGAPGDRLTITVKQESENQ